MSLFSSFIPGRFRLRSSLLCWEPAARVIVDALRSASAVKSVEHNALTGGLLIHYDSAQLPLSKALEAKPLFDRLQALEQAPRDRGLVVQIKDLCDQLVTLLG